MSVAIAAPSFPERRWLILIGLVTAAMLETLDVTITNVALPQIQGNVGATRQEAAWVSTGYIISNVVVLPMTAWLARRFGRRNYLTFSIAVFVAASVACGLSRSLEMLVLFRIVQGAAGAALLSTGEATLFQIFPKNERQLASGIFGLGVILGPTIGPALGGWITDNYSWPWIFFISVPIGAVAAGIIASLLTDIPVSRKSSPIDWGGILFLAAGLGAMQYILEEGQQNDWFNSALVVRLTIVSACGLIGLVVWELSPANKDPVVDLRVFKNLTLTGGVIVSLTLGFGMYTTLFLFPQFVQDILGFTATQSGLVMLLAGITEGVGIVLANAILSRSGADPRWIIAGGMVIFSVSMWQMSRFTMSSGMGDTGIAQLVRGLGLGAMIYCVDSTVLGTLKTPHDEQQGSALINLSRQLGGSFGIAISTTYLVAMTQYHRTVLTANIWAGNSQLSWRQQIVDQTLIEHGYSAVSSHLGGLAILNLDIILNSTTIAFEDAFLLIGLVFVFALPAVLLIHAKNVD